LPGISPTSGEVGCFARTARPATSAFLLLRRLRLAKAAVCAISPQVGEMPGRAEGGAVPPASKDSAPPGERTSAALSGRPRR
ncbi:MAG: hypothetical protein E5W78_20035, partial [Mesorhizobium sp.]